MIWDRYEDLSPAFLDEYHDLVLYHVNHQINACFLYPPNYSVKEPNSYENLRASITLSLNAHFYSKAEEEKATLDYLYATKVILKIPDDCFFRRNTETIYPIWLMRQEFKNREEENHYKIVDRLVWALLRLAKDSIKNNPYDMLA